MNKPLATLMQKEVTRKEFLATLGLGIATIMGFGSIIRFLSGKNQSSLNAVPAGYGSSVYGGHKR
jgi:Trp operon repressor